MERKNEKQKQRKQLKDERLVAHGKPFKGKHMKYGKYDHKSMDPKCPKNHKNKNEKKERM